MFILFLQPGCDTGSVYIDDMSLCEITPDPQPNLLVNGSFNGDLSGWFTFDSVFIDARSFIVRTPNGAAKMFTSGVPALDSGMYQRFGATPGSNWKMDLQTMTTCRDGDPLTGDNFMLASINFRDSGGFLIGGNEMVILDSSAPLGKWHRKSLIAANAPAGTDSVECLILFISPTLAPGAGWVDDVVFNEISTTGAENPRPTPGVVLQQNAPNPLRSSTRIAFSLEKSGPVDISIFDISGRRIASLFQGQMDAGDHAVTWDGRTDQGAKAASGLYRYVLRTQDTHVSRSMTLLR